MGRLRTEHYYMSEDQIREYRREKSRQYRERKANLSGRTIRHKAPDSHPSQMAYHERLAYNRECLRRHLEKQKYIRQ